MDDVSSIPSPKRGVVQCPVAPSQLGRRRPWGAHWCVFPAAAGALLQGRTRHSSSLSIGAWCPTAALCIVHLLISLLFRHASTLAANDRFTMADRAPGELLKSGEPRE